MIPRTAISTPLPARCNPFAMQHVESIPYRFESGSWTEHLERLEILGFRGSVVGPRGSGKTTLLGELAQRLTSHYRVEAITVPHDSECHPARQSEIIRWSRRKVIVLLDGFERFSWRRRRFLLWATRKHPLVVAVHKPGQLATWIQCKTNRQLLHHAIGHLPVAVNHSLLVRADQLLETHSGNIRDVLRQLYDDFAIGKWSADHYPIGTRASHPHTGIE